VDRVRADVDGSEDVRHSSYSGAWAAGWRRSGSYPAGGRV
jgi:hypothetical protein